MPGSRPLHLATTGTHHSVNATTDVHRSFDATLLSANPSFSVDNSSPPVGDTFPVGNATVLVLQTILGHLDTTLTGLHLDSHLPPVASVHENLCSNFAFNLQPFINSVGMLVLLIEQKLVLLHNNFASNVPTINC